MSLGPSRRSRAPFTGRGAHVGSPTLSTGHVGPAVTVTVSDPECSAPPDWPQPSATSSSNQITNRHLTVDSLTATPKQGFPARRRPHARLAGYPRPTLTRLIGNGCRARAGISVLRPG